MRRGITLFDLAVPALIVLIIAAVIRPDRAGRQRAEVEVAAVEALRWIAAAEVRFRAQGDGRYATLPRLAAAVPELPAHLRPRSGREDVRIGSYRIQIIVAPPPTPGFLAVARPDHSDLCAYAVRADLILHENPDGHGEVFPLGQEVPQALPWIPTLRRDSAQWIRSKLRAWKVKPPAHLEKILAPRSAE